jgi:hypothetical protein
VVYSWRVHAASTADDAATKPYIESSQHNVLSHYLEAQPHHDRFELVPSPLLAGEHFHFRRREVAARPMESITIDASRMAPASSCAAAARRMAAQDGLIAFVRSDSEIQSKNWHWEVNGILDLHPETVMVGGRILDRQERVVEAGMEFGFEDLYGSPNRGRLSSDPGYFAQVFKQRSVAAVSTRFAVVTGRFLLALLAELPPEASLFFLGAWAGAQAARSGQRVVYTPFLSATTASAAVDKIGDSEKKAFVERYGNLQDGRSYPLVFSRTKAFQLV